MFNRTISYNEFAAQSWNWGRLAMALKDVFRHLKSVVNNVILDIVFSILAFPLLWLLLTYATHLIRRSEIKPIDFTSSNYFKIRKSYTLVNEVLDKSKGLRDADISHLSFLYRVIVRQVQDMFKVIEMQQKELSKYFDDFSKLPNNQSPKILNIIPESELWEDKIPSYQYRF